MRRSPLLILLLLAFMYFCIGIDEWLSLVFLATAVVLAVGWFLVIRTIGRRADATAAPEGDQQTYSDYPAGPA